MRCKKPYIRISVYIYIHTYTHTYIQDSMAEFYETNVPVLCLKNRFHTSNAADHYVLLSRFILIWLTELGGMKYILQKATRFVFSETWTFCFTKFAPLFKRFWNCHMKLALNSITETTSYLHIRPSEED